MSLAGGWLLAPLVLGAVLCGTGLLAERAAGIRLPGALIPGAGLVTTIVLVGVLVSFTVTAPLAVPATVVATVAGLVLGRPWQRLRHVAVPLVLAVVVFGLFAAPSLLTGQGSVPGYVKLDDSVTWMVTIDRALDHGRDVDVPPGSYGATLGPWLGAGYPLGGFVPLGVAARLSGQDLVNAYAPTIAVLAAVVALGLYAIASTLIRSRALAAGAGLVAVQASVFLGYAMWGGIKEVCVAALLPVGAWTAVRGAHGARPLVLPIVATAAIFAALGPNGVVWAGPVLAAAGVAAWRNGLRSPLAAGALAVLLVVALLPGLTTLDFVRQTTLGVQGSLGDPHELGNLVRPLPVLQAAGLWPVGDFRLSPSPYGLAALLAVAGIGAATFAASLAVARGQWPLPALLAITLVGSVATALAGSPWVTAKAIAITAPIVLLAGATLVGLGLEERSAAVRLAAAGAGGVLLAGCAWSTLVVARDVYVAPRDRLAELRRIGQLVAGRAPTLQTDFDVYGDRWFLRDAQADGASDLRARHVRTAEGAEVSDLASVDTDALQIGDLQQYRTIVRRLSPTTSRPPGNYALLAQGAYWEAWTASGTRSPALSRLALGAEGLPASRPACVAVRSLAHPSPVRTLLAVPRRNPVVVPLADAGLPASWRGGPVAEPRTDGDAGVAVELPEAGAWRGWVRGGVLGSLELLVDGRSLGSRRHELAHPGQWLRFATTPLARGRHVVTLRYRRGSIWNAGRGGADNQLPLQAVALSPVAADRPARMIAVPAGRYRALCDGRTYDWIEAHR